jgi:glutathione peroxidase
MTTLGDFHATTIDGEDRDLGTYLGDVVLVVNTASQCGLTPQYEGLQKLYDEYSGRGLTILGFPCDQFGHQEPGTEDEIAGFCQRNYGVSFPMFAKIDVNGDDAHPLYKWLKSEKGGLFGGGIKWNFTKFLIGRDGNVSNRFAPQKEPDELASDIEAALAEAGGVPTQTDQAG